MVFIVAKWNVIILIKKNMYMKKEKGAEILMKKRRNISISVLLIFGMFVCMLTGCSGKSGKEEKVTEIEILQYKQEAAAYFEKVEEKFNATHKNIRLKIESPNDASTIMRTRFIREDYPDIIGIGGDINYSYFLDAEIQITKDSMRLKSLIKKLTKIWNLCRQTVFMQYRMPEMPQEFFIIKRFLKNTDGRYHRHGVNL